MPFRGPDGRHPPRRIGRIAIKYAGVTHDGGMAPEEPPGSEGEQRAHGSARRPRWRPHALAWAPLRELLVVLAACGASFVLAVRFDLFERFEAWAHTHEKYNVDELVVATVVGFVGLLVYSWRRLRQAQAEARQLALTEGALAETTERYRSLFDYNPNAVFSVGILGDLDASNSASQRLSGYTAAEISAMDVGALILPSHAEKTAAAFTAALNRQPQQVETALTHRDGHVVEVNITGLPIIVGDEVVGVYCIAEDITARKQMERDLQSTQRTAEEANEAKSLFLANVSHEIRTPLTSLLGTAEVMLDTDLDPLQLKFAETIHRSGERLLVLVTDILDFSKMEAGEAEVARGPIDVPALMQEVGALMRPVAEAKGLDFALRVDRSVPPVLIGDRDRLLRVLTGLLDNAVKFTEAGRVRASARVQRADTGSVDVHFVVEDTGIGISEQHQDRLFDSFSQADASITRKYNGAGLGLVLCRQLVTLMGGTMAVESTVGEGSVFSVVLPLATVPPPERAAPKVAVSSGGERVAAPSVPASR
jgi:PAS domain S-box-containing protein